MDGIFKGTERRVSDSKSNKFSRRLEDRENLISYYIMLGLISLIIITIGIFSYAYGYNI